MLPKKLKKFNNFIINYIFTSSHDLHESRKKYLSKATIVIEPDDNKIVNIEEVYSLEAQSNRINNQMAILKSDEVQEYIVKDKKNSMKFKNLYSSTKQNFFSKDTDKTKRS